MVSYISNYNVREEVNMNRGKYSIALIIFSLVLFIISFNNSIGYSVNFFKLQEPVYVNPIDVDKLVTVSPPLKPLPGIAIKEEEIPIKVNIPNSSFLNIWLDRAPGAVYMPGEEMTIYFMVSKDSYVQIYDITADGKAKLIFPNMYIQDNYLKAGNVYAIPLPGWFKLRVTPPQGKEYLQGFASVKRNLLSAKEKRLIKTGTVPTLDVRVLTKKFNLLLDPLDKDQWSSALVYFHVGIPENMPQEKVNVLETPSVVQGQVTTSAQKSAPVIVVTPTVQSNSGQFTQISKPLGGITISSIPQGADVFLDGIRKGITPITLENIETGPHIVRLELTGYKTLEENVYVPNSRIVTVMYSLIPIKKNGYIFILDAPKGAKVYIDGEYRGYIPTSGNLKLSVTSGYHNITIMKKGYNTWTRGVNVSSGEIVYIFPNS